MKSIYIITLETVPEKTISIRNAWIWYRKCISYVKRLQGYL